jgi:hypothetical protein
MHYLFTKKITLLFYSLVVFIFLKITICIINFAAAFVAIYMLVLALIVLSFIAIYYGT